jgi:hypothetical protein
MIGLRPTISFGTPPYRQCFDEIVFGSLVHLVLALGDDAGFPEVHRLGAGKTGMVGGSVEEIDDFGGACVTIV